MIRNMGTLNVSHELSPIRCALLERHTRCASILTTSSRPRGWTCSFCGTSKHLPPSFNRNSIVTRSLLLNSSLYFKLLYSEAWEFLCTIRYKVRFFRKKEEV